jgi:hypothetical protein
MVEKACLGVVVKEIRQEIVSEFSGRWRRRGCRDRGARDDDEEDGK